MSSSLEECAWSLWLFYIDNFASTCNLLIINLDCSILYKLSMGVHLRCVTHLIYHHLWPRNNMRPSNPILSRGKSRAIYARRSSMRQLIESLLHFLHRPLTLRSSTCLSGWNGIHRLEIQLLLAFMELVAGHSIHALSIQQDWMILTILIYHVCNCLRNNVQLRTLLYVLIRHLLLAELRQDFTVVCLLTTVETP